MKVANKGSVFHDNIISAMIIELNNKSAQQELMQQELQNIKYQLEQASKTLAQKDQIIGSLEQDLEHMIDQLGKIKHSHDRFAAVEA